MPAANASPGTQGRHGPANIPGWRPLVMPGSPLPGLRLWRTRDNGRQGWFGFRANFSPKPRPPQESVRDDKILFDLYGTLSR